MYDLEACTIAMEPVVGKKNGGPLAALTIPICLISI